MGTGKQLGWQDLGSWHLLSLSWQFCYLAPPWQTQRAQNLFIQSPHHPYPQWKKRRRRFQFLTQVPLASLRKTLCGKDLSTPTQLTMKKSWTPQQWRRTTANHMKKKMGWSIKGSSTLYIPNPDVYAFIWF